MSERLMLLAAGVLAAVAVAALPAVAGAGEFTATCGSGATCSGTVVSTGKVIFQEDSGAAAGRFTCTGATTGSTSQTSGSSTGSVELTFSLCTEGVFGTKCFNVGLQAEGKITTNTLTSHLIYLEDEKNTPVGALLTGVNVTFSCPSVSVTRTVTGNIIGEFENPDCGVARTHHTVQFDTFEPIITSPQKWRQITTTGTLFDLTSGSHAGDTTTASLVGTGHINYSGGNTVKLNC